MRLALGAALVVATALHASNGRLADYPITQLPDSGGWTDAGTKQGVALAFRENAQLHAREVRATAELPYAASLLHGIVCDLPAYPQFVPGIVEARLLEGTSPDAYVVYVRYAPRFIVIAPRDVVMQVRSGRENGGTMRCEWTDMPDRVPRRSGTVRMALDAGSWRLEPLGAARTRLVYQIAVKPGGLIPDWLVRWGAARALPEVIEAVRKRAAGIRE